MSAPIVGRNATHKGLRTARTLQEAFGPHASYAGLERAHRAGKLDRLVGIGCTLVLVGIAVAFVAGLI